MSQITSGIRAVLSLPFAYNVMQSLMGAHKVRKEFVDEFVRPEPGARILDLGCGTAEILSYLPNSVSYYGYDISPQYIAAAKAQYGSRGNFYCRILSASELSELPKFDIVLAIGVLHHLNDDEATHFFALAHSALRSQGRVVTIDPCLADDQHFLARYIIKKDRGQNVRTKSEYTSLASKVFSQSKGILRHRKWIPYTHWIMECLK